MFYFPSFFDGIKSGLCLKRKETLICMWWCPLINVASGLSVPYFPHGKEQVLGLKDRLQNFYLVFCNRGIKFWPCRDKNITITMEAAILFLKMSHMALKPKQIMKKADLCKL